jgi:hypothetical protein
MVRTFKLTHAGAEDQREGLVVAIARRHEFEDTARTRSVDVTHASTAVDDETHSDRSVRGFKGESPTAFLEMRNESAVSPVA